MWAHSKSEYDVTGISPASLTKLESDYRKWLCTMLPDHFRGLDQFAPHHDEYWKFVWDLPKDRAPKACFAPFNRKGMKSTGAEATCLALAALGKRSFGLYVSGTQDKADAHLESVKSMLIDSNIPKYYPKLASPKVNRVADKTIPGKWSHAELETAGGLSMISVGLNKSVRGLRKGNQRPDFIVLDDIEDESDSFYVVQKKIERLGTAVIPSGSIENCAVFFVQNLIHRDSVISQCLDGRADLLLDYMVCGDIPTPAVWNAEYKTVKTGTKTHHYITNGTPSWVGFDIAACEAELNKVGMRAWLREYQHKVKEPYDNALFPSFNEVYHVITWEDFARPFARFGSYDHTGNPIVPERGTVSASMDLGTTIGHPTVHLWDWQPSDEMPFNKDLFFFGELCRPRFPHSMEPEIVVPEAVGMEIQDKERAWGIKKVNFRQGSHEAAAVRNSFGFFLGQIDGYKNIHYAPIKTSDKARGVANVQDLLAIDYTQPHPFRIDPKTYTGVEAFCPVCKGLHDGRHLMGKPNLFLVVAQGQGELSWNPLLNEYEVAPALDETGFARTRWEFPRYRNRKTGQGVELQELPKIDDDAMDCLIADVAYRTRTPEGKTDEMRVDELLPEKFKKANVTEAQIKDPYFGMNQYTAMAAARATIKDSAPKDWRAPIHKKLYSRPKF